MVESESELPPELWAMPMHIKESIVDYSDTAEKLSLRQVDFKFKEIVEKSKIHYQKLALALRADRVKVSWQKTEQESVEQTFIQKVDGFEVIRDTYPVKTGKGDYRKAAVAKMFSVFKNSKVTVGELLIEVGLHLTEHGYEDFKFHNDRTAIFKEIERILSAKNFRLNVGKLEICFSTNQEMLISVLPYLEPGVLKVLHLIRHWGPPPGPYPNSTPVEDRLIFDTDQWKQLKDVTISGSDLDIPFEKCLHFGTVSLSFSSRPTQKIKTMMETIIHNETMRKCHFWYRGFDMTGAREYVDQFEKIPERSTFRRPCIKHPYEAGKRVEIEMTSHTLEIEKYDD